MNIAQMAAVALLQTERNVLLATIADTARLAKTATERWLQLNADVRLPGTNVPTVDLESGASLPDPGGRIGAVWPEALEANQLLLTALGDSVPRVLAALVEMQAAVVALHTAGQVIGIKLE